MKECTYKQQLPIFYKSYNNVRHLITSTIITLQHFATLHHTSTNYTSLHLSTLHFFSFTLHYPLIWLNPFTFPVVLFPITSLTSCVCVWSVSSSGATTAIVECFGLLNISFPIIAFLCWDFLARFFPIKGGGAGLTQTPQPGGPFFILFHRAF